MGTQTFKQLCSTRFDWPNREYEQRLFRQCLYSEAQWLVALVLFFSPGFFEKDYELIRQVAEVGSLEEMESELEDFRILNPPRGVLRDYPKLRVSTVKLRRLAKDLFSPASGTTPTNGATNTGEG